MYSRTCVVEISLNLCSDKTVSCSGVVIGKNDAYVLTVASLLSPFLIDESAAAFLNALAKQKVLRFKDDYQIFHSWCILENLQDLVNNKNQKSIVTSVLNCTQQENILDNSKLKYVTAHPLYIWHSDRLGKCFQELMSKENGWKVETGTCSSDERYIDDLLISKFLLLKLENCSAKCFIQEHVSLAESDSQNYKRNSKSWFPKFCNLPKVNISLNFHSEQSLKLKNEVSNLIPEDRQMKITKSSEACLVGTPFGSLSPSVFMNSISKGIISHVAGVNNVLIMTDARCIPGCEGGALYVKTFDSKWHLRALVIAGLCWKNRELLGFSLACDMHEIMSSLKKSFNIQGLTKSLPKELDTKDINNKISRLLKQVVHIKVGSDRGSGLIISSNPAIIITCSHVVRNYAKYKIHVKFYDRGQLYSQEAKLIYSVPAGLPFDIAVLEIDSLPKSFSKAECKIDTVLKEGTKVYAVGHACFDFNQDQSPVITAGVISKILTDKQIPFMIQTSSIVISGTSGGPLIDAESGAVIGLLTCNTKDLVSKISYPDLNLSIPMSAVWPSVLKYLKTRDPVYLSNLQNKSKEIQNFWNLHIDGTLRSNL